MWPNIAFVELGRLGSSLPRAGSAQAPMSQFGTFMVRPRLRCTLYPATSLMLAT